MEKSDGREMIKKECLHSLEKQLHQDYFVELLLLHL